MNKLLAILILITLTLSCKKFPQDQALFHINTVKQRLCRLWEMGSYDNNPLSINAEKPENRIYFSPDGKFYSIYFQRLDGYKQWEFINNNRKIRLISDNKTAVLDIIQLDFKSMRLKNDTCQLN